MTVHKEDAATDVDPVQIWSVKELEGEFTHMLKAYQDKETEFNWETRDKSVTRLRGLLRGNATDSQYLEVLVLGLKQVVDGIVKSVESLRTQLAVKSLLLVEDIGIFVGKYLDNYTVDQILLCMMRCSSLSKKIVASASFKATNIFLKHTNFYPKIMNMLNLSMTEKNSQIRLYAVGYTKTLLQTHAHKDHTRLIMDRTNSIIDYFETILIKGLNDPTPVVKEACREAFWIFWEYWRERGDYILKQLPSVAQKQLEKSKSTVKRQSPVPTGSKSLHSPTQSPRASSSLGRNLDVSPSNSNHISQPVDYITAKRPTTPQIRSPPPLSVSSHLQKSNSNTITPTSTLRKTRVPTIQRKKSSVGLNTKKNAPNFTTLLQSEDPTMRSDGFRQLAKKLSLFPYTPMINLSSIVIDIPNAPPMNGDSLKSIVLAQWEDDFEVLSSWDCVTNIMLKLLTFEEYLPRLILFAHADDSARRSESSIAKYEYANLALIRAKLFLQCENSDIVDTLFTSLVQYGGFVSSDNNHSNNSFGNKKDITKLPANRRKLTKVFLEWMDELVTPIIGLNEDIDYSRRAYEGVPDEFTIHWVEKSSAAVSWFELDDNIRQCLVILLPWTMSTSGTLWHLPLITFIKHIRLLNQRLFETITATYDDASVNKICRTLGVHIRIEPNNTVNIATIEDQVKIPQEEVEKEEDIPNHEKTEQFNPESIDVMELKPDILQNENQQENETPEITNETNKLTLGERDSILDHDVFSLPPVEVKEAQDEPIQQDYFTNGSLGHPISANHDIEREEDTINEYNSIVPDSHSSSLTYKIQNDTFNDNRTGSDACTETDQQQQQQQLEQIHQEEPKQIFSLLPCSIPDPVKYPVPQFVPFFAPEKVNYPNPVFKNNARTIISINASTTTSNNRNLKDKTILLYALIDKLKSSSSDHHQTFRKLIRLFKEVPIRRRWDQGGIEENGSETWAGAQGDAGNFVELIQTIIGFLDNNTLDEKYLAISLECIRQLAVTQAGLFRYYERKVNENGMTLESQLMERLLQIRSNENPTICIAAEDALDSLLGTLNPPTAFEMLMAFIIYKLLISPTHNEEQDNVNTRYHSVGSAFMYLGKWVKEMNDTFYIDEWLGKGGVNAFFKGLNHPLITIRKSCVDAIVAFHEVIGDNLYLFLFDLREDQSNLLRHYIAKSLKKRTSLRNLRDNNSQF